MSIRLLIRLVLAIPKTVYFNLHYFDLRNALKFPIIVSHRVRLMETKGKIVIRSPIKFGMIKIGLTDHMFSSRCDNCLWSVRGKIIFNGKATFGNGIKLRCCGSISFGKNFSSTSTLLIDCKDKIIFGNDVLIGWGSLIMDTDNHAILDNQKNLINPIKGIHIGNRVWICANCSIMKGVRIKDDIVIASHSVITKSINHEIVNKSLIGGYPARVLKKGISWRKVY